jgi:predicted  nucleic acid-binding Zn-ribbon protein
VLRRTQVENGVRDLRIRVEDLTAEQKRADADVEQVKTRRVRDQGMIDSGQIADPKALERMLDELKSLQRRITSLEDTELEVMEELEATQTHLDHETAAMAALDEERTRLQQALDEKAADVQAQLAAARAERVATVAGMPEDLMTLYTKLREQKGGVGAAALRRRECEGCRLTLNASDLAVIAKAPADEVLRCEECNRILVRTPESGL